MPQQDIFLLTGDYNWFLNWVQETRKAVMNLNTYRPDNYVTVQGLESLQNFLIAKGIGSGFKHASEANKQADDIYIKDHFNKDTAQISADIKKLSEQQKAIEDNVNASKLPIKQSPDFVLHGGEKFDGVVKLQEKIATELKDRSQIEKIGDEFNYKTPEERIDGAIIPPSLTTAPFPNAGPEVTERMRNEWLEKDEYKVFSGRKNKSPEIIYKGFVSKGSVYGKPGAEMSSYYERILSDSSVTAPTGTYKFFIEKLHGRYYTATGMSPFQMNPVVNDQTAQKKTGGYNFANRKVFAAFIDNYNDDYSVEWNSYNFIGRAEKSYAYKGTDRKFALDFSILADHSVAELAALDVLNEKVKGTDKDSILEFLLNQDTIDWGRGTYIHDSKRRLQGANSTMFDNPETMWQKLTFLAQCCYPYYRTDGKMKEAPMTRIRIGDFYDVICCITSMNIQNNVYGQPDLMIQPGDLGEQIMGVKVTISGYIIHDYEPSSEFYGFYHRKQFDEKKGDEGYKARVWGAGLSKNLDLLTTILQKHSPLDIKNILNSGNIVQLLNTIDVDEIVEDVRKFKENFKGLEAKGVNLLEQIRKFKLKNIFDAIKSIKDKKAFFEAIYQIQTAVNKVNNAANNPIVRSLGLDDMTNKVSDLTNKVNAGVGIMNEYDQLMNNVEAVTRRKERREITRGKIDPINGSINGINANPNMTGITQENAHIVSGILPPNPLKTIGDITNNSERQTKAAAKKPGKTTDLKSVQPKTPKVPKGNSTHTSNTNKSTTKTQAQIQAEIDMANRWLAEQEASRDRAQELKDRQK